MTFDSAVSGGHIDCLDYLYKHDCPDWECMYNTAVRSGQLESIKWLYAAGYPLNEDVFAQAAYTGNLECMELLYRLGCPLDIVTPANAAWKGHISCLKWLYEHGCYFDARICMWAAIGGHLECLKLLRGTPILCPWDHNTLVGAYANNKHECFMYARENGCPGVRSSSIVFKLPEFPYSTKFDKSYKLDVTIHYPICWLD